MNLTLTFCTNYNGVYINPTDDDAEVTTKMYEVFDHIADTFPEYTYDMCEKFDTDLTKEQEKELCDKAAKLVSKVIPNPVVTFEYDSTSS